MQAKKTPVFKGTRKKIPHLACLLVRLLRYIQRHLSRYAPLDVPCRRAQIRRNLVELFLTVNLTSPFVVRTMNEI
jgi:hypothetical protein